MKTNKDIFINKELNLVHMNEKEFKVFYQIYISSKSLYLREIVEKTKLSYGTVQAILNRNLDILEVRDEGKNKYFTFKKNIDFSYLRLILEIENTRLFIAKNNKLSKFVFELKKLNLPILIFGSYAKDLFDKNSDLDILIFSDKQISLPTHLVLNILHPIYIQKKDFKKFKNEVLYKEVLKNHVIINGFDFILNEVFENE